MKLNHLLIFAILIINGCKSKVEKTSSLQNYLPENTALIVKVNDLSRVKSELKNNTFVLALNTLDIYKKVADKIELLNTIDTDSRALLAFVPSKTDTTEVLLVIPNAPNIAFKDSLISNTKQPIEAKGLTIDTYKIKEQVVFKAIHKNNLLLTSSVALMEQAIEQSESAPANSTLNALMSVSNTQKAATAYIKTRKSQYLEKSITKDSTKVILPAYADWLSFDMDSPPDELKLNGIALAQDSTLHIIDLFEKTSPILSATPLVAPINADAILSYSLLDYDQFAENQKVFLGNSFVLDSLFNGVEELGHIYSGETSAVVLHTYASENIAEFLENNTTKVIDHQGIEIAQLSRNDFLNNFFNPLVRNFDASFYTVLENAFVFGPNQNMLKNIISNYKRNDTFANGKIFKTLEGSLANESSILFISNATGMNNALKTSFSPEFVSDLKQADISKFAFAGQMIADNSFYHTNAVVKEIGSSLIKNTSSLVFSLQLDAELLTDPQFVLNHRTGKKEIVVQDVANNLYLISTAGKVLWKKQLGSKIQGQIAQVDIYKNGRLQLAFTTTDRFLILDRNGKEVQPFDMKFEGGNLNPLAVFDYDKRKNYRFVVTQGPKVFMYNSKGKIVSGFKYTQAESNVLFNPKHFRIGSRDYLVFMLENGRLKILNREGKVRIPVNEVFEFSENECFLYKNRFTLTDNQGTLVVIDEKGGISKTKFNFNPDHGVYATSKTLVTMNDNELTIKGKKISLDLGVYTKPKIYYLYDKIYVGVTDLQSQQVYLFDSTTKNISNFPVMGGSIPDLIDMDNDKKVEVVAKENDNGIVVYKIN